jgi:hypothetical protein
MSKIKAISNGKSAGEVVQPDPISNILLTDIPQESLDAYAYQVGNTLDPNVAADVVTFNNLSYADKYHMLMPSGYAKGWADAFTNLGITTAIWKTLPPTSTCSGCDKFGAPADANTTMDANDVRSKGFEDIPAYLYSGGLIDMHGHVNISGLIYVPQAMELEAKSATTRQYVSGAIVIRDGFYIEADNSTITVISANPQTYSTAKRTISATTPPTFSAEPGGPGAPPPGDVPGGGDDPRSPCIGCSTGGGGGSAGGASSKRLWMEIRPL